VALRGRLERLVLRGRRRRVGEVRDLLVGVAAEPPRGDGERDHGGDTREREHHPAPLEPPMLPPDVRAAPRHHGLARLLVPVARVELVDVELPVEPQVVRVRAQEALDVRLGRKRLEVLLLEGAQVARPDLRCQLDLAQLEVLADASLAQAVADLEHGEAPIVVA
jgi:hypothetical protein